MMKNKIFITVIVLSTLISCGKDPLYENLSTLKGRWYPVDGSSLTDKYVEFASGKITTYTSQGRRVCALGSIWGSQSSDFRASVSEGYTIDDGVLFTRENNYGRISIDGDDLTIGDSHFARLRNFKRESYSSVSLNTTTVSVGCLWSRVTVEANVSNPIPGYPRPILSCGEDWIVTDGLDITFSVNNLPVARETSVKVSYPCCEDQVIKVTQFEWGIDPKAEPSNFIH